MVDFQGYDYCELSTALAGAAGVPAPDEDDAALALVRDALAVARHQIVCMGPTGALTVESARTLALTRAFVSAIAIESARIGECSAPMHAALAALKDNFTFITWTAANLDALWT